MVALNVSQAYWYSYRRAHPGLEYDSISLQEQTGIQLTSLMITIKISSRPLISRFQGGQFLWFTDIQVRAGAWRLKPEALSHSLLGALSIHPKVTEISLRNQINWTDHFRSVRPEYFGPPLKGSTLTGLVISVGRTKFPFSLDKIVVPSTALLYPAYKNNNQTLGSLDRVCASFLI